MHERELFFERHPDPMWIFDLSTLEILDVNAAATAAYGYTREEFLGLKATDIRPPEDVPAFLDAIRSPARDRREGRTFRHRAKDGRIFHVDVTAQEIDWQGRRTQLVSVRDVTRSVLMEQERSSLLEREAALRLEAEQAAERLAEQNSNLRTVQRLIGVGSWKFERWSGRLHWSPEVFRMYRVDEAGFGGAFEDYRNVVHPDDRQEMARNFEGFTQSGSDEFDFAHRILRPDGTVIHVRGVGERSMTPDGELLTGMVQDVTRQVEQSDRLRLLDLSVSRLNDIVVIFEAHPGPDSCEAPIVYMNAAYTRVTGLSEADVIGRPVRDVMFEVAKGVPLEVLQNALAAETSLRSDLQLFTKDGRVLPAEIDLVPVRNAMGAVTHWVAVMRDMSEKQAADARARLNEERYRMLSMSTHDVVWDWDIRSGLLGWNENFRQLAGAPEASLTDWLTSWSDRLHPEDHDRVLAGFHGAIAGTGDTWSDEYRFMRDDGDVRFVFDRGFILRDETGRALRIVGSIVDITQRKIAEARLAQAEKLDALGQMTGGVAHDFNNLLTVIIGNTETLLDRTDDARQRRLLELVSGAAERGRELTGRLLAFARRMPLKPLVLNLNEQVRRSAELMRRTFRSNVRLEFDLKADVSTVEADPGQLELALLNLTINARDSMPDGGTLTVSTADVPAGKPVPGFPRAETASADRIMLSVKDTGSGMDAETLRRCLEPFFTTKPVGKGAGLGLSMAYGFAEQSGGRLLIRSEPGQGTEVAMLFPCSSQPVLAMPTVNPASRPLGGSEQILVVEDDDGVRDHAARVLGDLGYRVTPVETADAAISYLRAGGTADLILSDIMMPGVADVRKLEAEARALLPEIQILYSSGYPKELIQADGRLAPDIELLPKPYRRSELALKVREMLDRTYARPGAATQDAD